MYTYTAELFPTNVRTVGLGLGSLGGGLGGIIAPYILTLQVSQNDILVEAHRCNFGRLVMIGRYSLRSLWAHPDCPSLSKLYQRTAVGIRRPNLRLISETANFDQMASRCYFFNILYSLCLFPSSTARNKRKTTLRICCRRRKSMVTRKKWQKVITWQQNDFIGRI